MGSFLLEKEGKTPWTNVVDEPYYSRAKTVSLRAGRRSEREARRLPLASNEGERALRCRCLPRGNATCRHRLRFRISLDSYWLSRFPV